MELETAYSSGRGRGIYIEAGQDLRRLLKCRLELQS